MIRVELYARAGCHLCQEAKKVLERVRREIPFELSEVDVDSDPALREQYGEQVPVLFVQGEKAFKYRIDERKLRRRLRRLM